MEVFYKACPGCGGIASWKELVEYGLCRQCMKKGLCNSLPWLCSVKDKVEEFGRFFSRNIGEMTPLQRYWATRFFSGLSFPLTAPTGLGKTTFAIQLAMFLAGKGFKSYLMFPTRALVEQAAERMKDGFRIFKYPGMEKETLFKGEFDIAITTSAFFHKNHESIPPVFRMVFVDDVDSFMKSRRNVERLSRFSNSQILMSSATAKPRPAASRLLLERFGFRPARPFMPFRNVIDCMADDWREVVEFMNRKGHSGILFVESREKVERAVDELRAMGIKAFPYEMLEEFKKEGGVVIGISHPLNPLVRGIDLPERIEYVVFSSVPKVEIKVEEINERNARLVAIALSPLFPELRNAKPERIKEILADREALERIEKSREVSFRDGKVVFADVTTYIQASGRASRLTKEGITTGLSIIIPDDEKAFNFLERRLRWIHGIEIRHGWKEYEKELGKKKPINPRSLVVVVESPTKAKTISSFFSRPGIIRELTAVESPYLDIVFVITASKGHVTDMTNDGFFGLTERGPVFGIIEGKEQTVASIRKLSLNAELFIATDPDREGEKIAFDIKAIANIFASSTRRMEFHEITRKAFLNALANAADIKRNVVNAQLVRRIADRLIGFSASQFLQDRFSRKTLSAGRVQTPVLGWIIERWKESREKKWMSLVEIGGEKIWLEGKFDGEVDAEIRIEREEKIIVEEPLDTETLLRKSFFTPEKTMEIAQSLFEKGLITYHRTDSKRVSEAGMEVARYFIEREFGKEYLKLNKGKGEGAHECIRPTKPFKPEEVFQIYGLSKDEFMLYRLIFQQFMASQMRPVKAIMGKATVVIYGKKVGEFQFIEDIIEHGWDLIKPIPTRKIPEGRIRIFAKSRRVPKAYPFRYSEVIAMMKERGIGRPSTYAITIQKLKERKYVIDSGGRLIPTRLGIKVYETLMKSRFREYLEESYTANLESLMDKVEEGEADWNEIVESLAKSIRKKI